MQAFHVIFVFEVASRSRIYFAFMSGKQVIDLKGSMKNRYKFNAYDVTVAHRINARY